MPTESEKREGSPFPAFIGEPFPCIPSSASASQRQPAPASARESGISRSRRSQRQERPPPSLRRRCSMQSRVGKERARAQSLEGGGGEGGIRGAERARAGEGLSRSLPFGKLCWKRAGEPSGGGDSSLKNQLDSSRDCGEVRARARIKKERQEVPLDEPKGGRGEVFRNPASGRALEREREGGRERDSAKGCECERARAPAKGTHTHSAIARAAARR